MTNKNVMYQILRDASTLSWRDIYSLNSKGRKAEINKVSFSKVIENSALYFKVRNCSHFIF